jgi:DNA-directed RNA polymerase specialized sigma24 family protein
MDEAAGTLDVTADRRLMDTIARERGRLRNFIRKRVADIDDAEDILQDVFSELVEATRLMTPSSMSAGGCSGLGAPGAEEMRVEDLLPSPDAGPEAAYARRVLLEELEAALDELPEEQRDVLIAHEIEGRSFTELAAETGLSINTLLGRKRYAVLRLRRRLEAIHEEFRNS